MGAVYGSLWTNQLQRPEAVEAIKAIWFVALKQFQPEEIQEALKEAMSKFKMPPKPAELIEIIKFNRARAIDDHNFRILDQKRLLPTQQKASDSLEVLEAKVKMWQNLGLTLKADKVQDEINARIAECEKVQVIIK